MAARCFCGAAFVHADYLRTHANGYGHNLKCSCGFLFQDEKALHDHCNTSAHIAGIPYFERLAVPEHVDKLPATHCNLCNAISDTATALTRHQTCRHHACPICHQVFADASKLLGHQKAVIHCYCAQHDMAFTCSPDMAQHNRTDGHVTGYDCMLCNRQLGSEIAMNDHLSSRGHALIERAAATREQEATSAAAALREREEKALRCEACDRAFPSIHALRQHKSSVKHKPLSDLKCPLSGACANTFTSPSALLFHLESGKCKSGMNRDRLNAIVFQHDNNRHITSAAYAGLIAARVGPSIRSESVSSLAGSLAGLSLGTSGAGGSILTPDESDTCSVMSDSTIMNTPPSSNASSSTVRGGGVILTPSASSRSSQALSQWSFLDTPQLTPATTSVTNSTAGEPRYNPATRRWHCGLCARNFRKHEYLLQHLSSPAHAPKIFHCPTTVPGLGGQQRRTLQFKTLSGLAQHIETGAGQGGQETLRRIAGIFEQKIQARTGRTVELLQE